jgi:hypothetical protein
MRRWWKIRKLFKKRLIVSLCEDAGRLNQLTTLNVSVVISKELVRNCSDIEVLADLVADEARGSIKRALMRSLPA